MSNEFNREFLEKEAEEVRRAFGEEFQPVIPPVSDAAITACAIMIQGICLIKPREEWVKHIENRIRYMLLRRN